MKKGTENFKKVIQQYVENRAKEDETFAPFLTKEGKNIDDCITYILNTVKKSEAQGFTDDEIYSMAIHYYVEDIVDIGSAVDMKVIVNHTIQLTEEELAEAKKEAMDKAISEAKQAMQKKSKPDTRTTNKEQQGSLFDL